MGSAGLVDEMLMPITALGPRWIGRVVNFDNSLRGPFSRHPNSVNVVMIDGAVKSIHESIDAKLFLNLCTISDGNVALLD